MQRWTNGIECLEWSEWCRSTMQYAYSLAWIPDPACVRLSSPPVLYRQTWFVQLWLWHVLLLGTIAALALANTWQKSMQMTACFKQRWISHLESRGNEVFRTHTENKQNGRLSRLHRLRRYLEVYNFENNTVLLSFPDLQTSFTSKLSCDKCAASTWCE